MANLDWTKIIASGEAEPLWNAIYLLVREKGLALLLKSPGGRFGHLSVNEIDSEMTQEVFLRLISTDRLSYFIANNYTSEQIESELLIDELSAVLLSRIGTPTGGQDPTQDGQLSPVTTQDSPLLTLPAAKLICGQ